LSVCCLQLAKIFMTIPKKDIINMYSKTSSSIYHKIAFVTFSMNFNSSGCKTFVITWCAVLYAAICLHFE
jgi:hypothetical protein